ncbi:MAG: HAMP domain-containing sensor histidine kinase [Candidatus Marinimicrobia bacterium]|nr:HAMP domain-containing sensor histidine kinase [Candidatus Neomarinimicrobiota bacterium]
MTLFPETPAFSTASMLRRDHWLIRLRWFAILGLLSGVVLLKTINLGPSLSITWMGIAAGILVFLNLLYMGIASGKRQLGMSKLVVLLNAQMVMDLLVLTLLVYITGSEESPLSFFYVFHIILASIIFPGGFSYLYSMLVIALYSGLLVLEHSIYVDHICFFHDIHLADDLRIVVAIWFIFVITMVASAYLAQSVTERHRRVRAKLEVANQKLQEVNETKTTFFRYASHEMKTPIATIQSTLMVIEDVLGNQVDDRVKDMVHRAVNRTAEMIEMLKDLADLTYGNMQEQKKFEKLDLSTLINELVTEAQPNAERKQQTLSLKATDHKFKYFGDMLALKKIFSNLISNAIRYTPENGEIKVKLKRMASYYQVAISDNGLGIPESEQINIFKEFYRTPTARKQVTEGTGLGLAIVMRMVELHDGTISVKSKMDQGSKFIVELPIGEIS